MILYAHHLLLYLRYSIVDDEVGDLELTKALVNPVLNGAPVSVKEAEMRIAESG